MKTNSRGVPFRALIATAVLALAFFWFGQGQKDAYTWLVNASGLAGFITWCGIAWSHLKFRRAYVAQGGNVDELPFKAKWFPLGPIVALIMCIVVIAVQNSDLVFNPSHVKIGDLFQSYGFLLVFFALWGGHKLVTRSPKVAAQDADLTRPGRS